MEEDLSDLLVVDSRRNHRFFNVIREVELNRGLFFFGVGVAVMVAVHAELNTIADNWATPLPDVLYHVGPGRCVDIAPKRTLASEGSRLCKCAILISVKLTDMLDVEGYVAYVGS